MAITRTAITDDDGSGTTGTVLNAAWKDELYDQIDGAFSVFVDPSAASAGDVLTADGAGGMAFAAPGGGMALALLLGR